MENHPSLSSYVKTHYDIAKDGFSVSVGCCGSEARGFLGMEVVVQVSREEMIQGLFQMFHKFLEAHPAAKKLIVQLTHQNISYETNYEDIVVGESLTAVSALHSYQYNWELGGGETLPPYDSMSGEEITHWAKATAAVKEGQAFAINTGQVAWTVTQGSDTNLPATWNQYFADDDEWLPGGRPPEVNKLPGLNETVKHPETGKMERLEKVVINLNDYYEWTREQIADWLDTLDIDLRFQIREEDTHDKVG